MQPCFVRLIRCDDLVRKSQTSAKPLPCVRKRQRRVKSGVRKTGAPISKTTFDRKRERKMRLKNNTVSIKRVCPICSKSFLTATGFREHCKIHGDKRPYKCAFCSKLFSYISQLAVHIRRHTGDKPYQCSTCPKKYSRPTQLKLHIRTHTGEKPHQCSHCSKRFSRPSSFYLHLKTHAKSSSK